MSSRNGSSAAQGSPLFEGFESWMESTGRHDGPIGALRRKAFERLVREGMPTRRHEDWRFTDLGPIAQQQSAVPPAQADGDDIDGAPPLEGLKSLDLRLHDGRLTAESRAALAGFEGLTLHDLASAEDAALEVSRESWERGVDEDATPLERLNAMWCDRGAVLEVAPRTVLDRPVRLILTSSGVTGFLQTRLVVRLGRQSQATVIEDHAGGSKPASTNFVVDVEVGDNAHLEHVKLVRSACEDFQASSLRARIGRDGRYRHWNFVVGGRWMRNDLHCTLSGENSEVSLMGLVVAGGEEMVDNHTRVVHAGSHARSHENYRHVLDDRARAVFAGRVLVERDVQGTEAEQQNATLLLSDAAKMNALPQLEIYNDDVTASHGATMGQLDDESLFYLRSRGIPEATARALLLWGFANTIVQELGSEPLSELLRDEIQTHLRGLDFLGGDQ